jgi:hypothetical protein
MKLSRPSRFVAALIALFSVLFMQFAVAAYACPGLMTGQSSEPAAMSSNTGDEGMEGCTEMDMEQPSLCHAYVHVGDQSLDKPGVPPVQPFTSVALVVTLMTADVTRLPVPTANEPVSLTRSTAPPISIRNCCFRI